MAVPLIGRPSDAGLHVMSFNLRVGVEGLPDPWPERRPVAAELLADELPTVIGTQEGVYHQLREVHADLSARYDWIGQGRSGGSHGEFNAVIYDAERLDPLEYDHFWLSDTPEVVGSSSWGNRVVRMATWVRFADASSGREFVLLNTHLDHAVELARFHGAELLRQRIEAFDDGLPVIVTGDFNDRAGGSRSYDVLLGAGLIDTWNAAEDRLTKPYATFHGYRPAVPGGDRIDWILTSPGIRVRVAAVNTFVVDGRHASDHWPVQVLLDLP